MIAKQYFLIFVTGFLVLTLVGSGILYYNMTQVEPQIGIFDITIEISYAGLKNNDSSTITVETYGNVTLFDVMNSSYELSYTVFGIGYFIEGINRVYNNVNITNFYWIIYINGATANVGASQIKPQGNFVYLFSYEAAY
jgi:hypothetical protein